MMNSQSFNPFKGSAFLEEPGDSPLEPQQGHHSGPVWRLWKAWLWLTGPRPERFGTGTAARETLRRSRLISALLILVAIVIILLAPSALTIPNLWQPILILAAPGVLAAILNRYGRVTLSGLVIIALADASITQNIARQQYGLTNTTAADLYLLVIAVLVAGMVLPNLFIPITGALQVLISIALFKYLPHDTLLSQEIQKVDGGMEYTSVLGPILLQVCGTFIVWLYAWSVDRAIVRASRAEELAEARARLNDQARQINERKQRLEAGISALQAVQARVANGEYSARVSLEGNELLPLAVSFNLMAERLGRVERIEQDHHRLEQALQQLLDTCNVIARGATPAAMRTTGTPADRVFPFLVRLHKYASQLTQGSGLAEDLRTVLQHQHEYLVQTEAKLIGALALARDLAIETVQIVPRVSGEITSGSLRTSSKTGEDGTAASGPLRAGGSPDARENAQAEVRAHISNLLDQQAALLEQANRYCQQARDLGTRCTQGARIISQRLKEAG